MNHVRPGGEASPWQRSPLGAHRGSEHYRRERIANRRGARQAEDAMDHDLQMLLVVLGIIALIVYIVRR